MQPNNPLLPDTMAPAPPVRLAIFGLLSILAITAGAYMFAPTPKAPQVAAATAAIADTTAVSVSAESAYVYDMTDGTTLFAKNPDTPLALASVTKLMLAAVVSDYLSPSNTVPITTSSLAPEGDSGLIVGESWRMQELLDFTLIMSSNDGAAALAEAAGRVVLAQHPEAPQDPVLATVWAMNQKASTLGLTKTYYLSPNGLDASETMAGAYGSARDMAILFAYIVRTHPQAVAATAYQRDTFTSLEGTRHTAVTTNDSIGTIPGLIAGKTGYTDLAGGNLAIVFDTSLGHPIVVVVLGSTKDNRFSDVQTLAEFARASTPSSN